MENEPSELYSVFLWKCAVYTAFDTINWPSLWEPKQKALLNQAIHDTFN